MADEIILITFNSYPQPQHTSFYTTIPNLHPSQPPSYQPSSGHSTNHDACILPWLFFYSAAFVLVHCYLYIFSFLLFIVLLLSSAYLKTPRHILFHFLSVFSAPLPFHRVASEAVFPDPEAAQPDQAN